MQSNAVTRLDETEIQEVEQMQPEQRTQFEINDLGTATWAFRKLHALEKKITEVNEVAQTEIDRINEWKEKEVKNIQQSMEYFENLLTFYYTRQKEVDPKFKLSTPYGSVSSRKLQPKWEYKDEALVKWLKENNHADLVRTKEEAALADMKTAFTVTEAGLVIDSMGTVVEGIAVIEQGSKITVKTKGE